MHAAEGDDIGGGFLGVVGEAEGITDVVRHVLDISRLVVMGEDHGVARLFKGEDFLFQVERGSGGGHGWTLAGVMGSDNAGVGNSTDETESIL
jgi:hypothetical protein